MGKGGWKGTLGTQEVLSWVGPERGQEKRGYYLLKYLQFIEASGSSPSLVGLHSMPSYFMGTATGTGKGVAHLGVLARCPWQALA